MLLLLRSKIEEDEKVNDANKSCVAQLLEYPRPRFVARRSIHGLRKAMNVEE